jgi:hypothetical protein
MSMSTVEEERHRAAPRSIRGDQWPLNFQSGCR